MSMRQACECLLPGLPAQGLADGDGAALLIDVRRDPAFSADGALIAGALLLFLLQQKVRVTFD